MSFEKFHEFYKSASTLFSRDVAIAHARDFSKDTVVPLEFNDSSKLRNGVSLVDLVRQQHAINDSDEFNLQRYDANFASLPSDLLSAEAKEILREIADVGSRYCVPPDFEPDPTLQELRRLTRDLGNTQLFHALKLRKKNKCILLRIDELPDGFLKDNNVDCKGMAHWTTKFDAAGGLLPEGRFLIDLNMDPFSSGHFLNSDACKLSSRLFYGPCHYNAMPNFIQRLYNYCEDWSYQLTDIRFFVEDNKGAFNSHKKNPSSCPLVCIRVSEDYIMIPTYGSFGHHAEPFVWEASASATDVVINQTLRGVMGRYVDDRFIGSHYSHASADRLIVIETNRKVYGPFALDDEKSQDVNTFMTAIGWTVCSATGTIRPNTKGVMKMTLAFFSISTSPKATWSLQQVQSLASLAERYSWGVIGMRPFVQCFNAMCSGNWGPHSSNTRRPSADAKFAVMMWRAVCVSLFADPLSLAMPLFAHVQRDVALVDFRPLTDAANKVGMFLRDNDLKLLNWLSYRLPFDAPESDFQNTKEFIGMICAILAIRLSYQAPRGTCIEWTNDNMSALAWVVKHKAKSAHAQFAFAAYSWLLVATGYIIVNVEHIAGASETMEPVDGLSRDRGVADYDPLLEIDISKFPHVDNLLRLLDPTLHPGDCVSVLNVFESISSCIRDICS